MLTKEQLKGMWVSVPIEWDEQGNFDEKTFRDEIIMLIDAGAHGLYTEEEYDQFLVDVYEAVADIALIHYNITRTKKLFLGKDYARVSPRVALMGGLSPLTLLEGLPQQVFEEAAACCRAGGRDGGYILAGGDMIPDRTPKKTFTQCCKQRTSFVTIRKARKQRLYP